MQVSADDFAIVAKQSPPETVTQENNMLTSVCVVLSRELSAELGPNAKERKQS
jgi:hypothetical protein